jgi:hypothetical protein
MVEKLTTKLLSNIKSLYMLDTKIYMRFNKQMNNKYYNLFKLVLDKSESSIILNIIFNEGREDLLTKPFSYFEDIYTNFYAIASTTRFINDKRVYITFPQLFNSEPYATSPLVTILYNQSERIELNDEQLTEISDSFEGNSVVAELKANEVWFDKSKLKLFNYDSLILGGSFDHMHLGHNVITLT